MLTEHAGPITWGSDPRRIQAEDLLPCPACNGQAGRATPRASAFQHFIGLYRVSCQNPLCAMGATYFHPVEWNRQQRHAR